MSELPSTARPTAARILSRTSDLLRANWLPALAAMILLTALGLAADLEWTGAGGQFLLSVGTMVMQFWLTSSALDSLGLRTVTATRFPAFFLVSIVTSLGVLIGVVLLVLPGIFLLGRWSIAAPAVIAADRRFAEAIDYSWRETSPHFWPILVALALVYGAAAAGAFTGIYLESGEAHYAGTLIFELSLNAGFIAGWHAAVAIYAETTRDNRHAEVFA